MPGYASITLINEVQDFKKNRLAKMGKANNRTLQSVVKTRNTDLNTVVRNLAPIAPTIAGRKLSEWGVLSKVGDLSPTSSKKPLKLP